MGELSNLFTNNLLPIFLIVGASFLFGRYTGVSPRQLSQLVFHLFSPCLLVSPIVAFLLIPLFGLVGPARQALILEAAMPTAVLTTVPATEFNAEPSFVSATVLMTTLLTPLTLTPLLASLGA